MFTVAGYIREGESVVGYRVGVGAAPGPGVDGIVQGSANARSLLAAAVGDVVRTAPFGRSFVVDLNDPAAVLAALYALTDVRQVEGENVPDVVGGPQPGTLH